jgi:hypothetical protein
MLGWLKNKLADRFQYGLVPAFFNIFQGRATTFAIAFTIAGVWGFIKGRDLTSFALFVTAIQGMVVMHSFKEDVHEQRMARLEMDRMKADVTSDLENNNGSIKGPSGQ